MSNRLPLFVRDRSAAAVLAAGFIGFLGSEYFLGKKKPPLGSSNQDNGSGRAVGRGLVLSYGGGLLVSVASPRTVCTRHPRAVFASGLSLALLGQVLRVAAARRLGQSFTFKIHTHPEQEVVQSGPYRFIRHPAYTGALVCALGFCIAFGNWLSPAMVAFLVGGYVQRIPSEEAAMVDGLGDRYSEYISRSKRLVPFIF